MIDERVGRPARADRCTKEGARSAPACGSQRGWRSRACSERIPALAHGRCLVCAARPAFPQRRHRGVSRGWIGTLRFAYRRAATRRYLGTARRRTRRAGRPQCRLRCRCGRTGTALQAWRCHVLRRHRRCGLRQRCPQRRLCFHLAPSTGRCDSWVLLCRRLSTQPRTAASVGRRQGAAARVGHDRATQMPRSS